MLGIIKLKPFEVAKDMEYQKRLVDAGLLEVLIDLLSQCKNEEISNILPNGGDEQSGPWLWVHLLDRFSRYDTSRSLGVVSNAGFRPFIKCMCNCHKREFFRSTNLWYESVGFFIGLVRTLVKTRDAADILLQQDEDVLNLLVQSIFWNDQPDMAKSIKEHIKPIMLSMDPMEVMSNAAVLALHEISGILVHETVDDGLRKYVLKSEPKRLLQYIGKTPVPDNMHGNEHKVPFVVALINVIKSTKCGATKIFVIENMISSFVVAGCVDKEVIAGIIDYGLHFISCVDPVLGGDPEITLTIANNMMTNDGILPTTRCSFCVCCSSWLISNGL